VNTRSKILFVLVVLLILGFIFLTPHGRYRHELEAYKQQLVARGEKLTIAELAPPPSIDPSNGAKAFMQFMGNYSSPTDYPSAMKMVAPGLAEIGCTNDAAVMSVNYARNMRQMVELRNILNASVLDFDLNYSQGYDLPLPHQPKLKAAEQLASASTIQTLHAKNYSEARSDLLAAVDLVRLSPNEPFMVSGLVRVAMAQIAIYATWESLQSGEWNDPQLTELQAQWHNLDFFQNPETSIIFERAEGIAAVAAARQMNRLDPMLSPLSTTYNMSGTPSRRPGLVGFLDDIQRLYNRSRFGMWKSTWSYDEELCYLQTVDAAVASCRLANATGAFVPVLEKLKQEDVRILRLHPAATNQYLLFFSGSGRFESYLLKLARVETARRLTVTAIALKRYHLQHGVYPSSLNDLVPAFLPAVPADFMDGQPLRYKLRPDGDFLLYSVGEDGKDDGGDPTPVPPSTSFYSWLNGRDIVWPRVATPAALEEYHRLSQSMTNERAK
jgi:hypothetical protein